MGSCSLLQGTFPTQGSSPGIPNCRQILYHLSHQGNSRILEWVEVPFSRGSSQPRYPTWQAASLPAETPGKSKMADGFIRSQGTDICREKTNTQERQLSTSQQERPQRTNPAHTLISGTRTV